MQLVERIDSAVALVWSRVSRCCLVRQLVDAGEQGVVVAKAPCLGCDPTGVQATALEQPSRYAWGDLTFEPECLGAQRRTDRCRNIAASDHQPCHLTADLRRGDDLGQASG